MVSSAKGFCLQIKSLELRYVFSYLTIKVKINIALFRDEGDRLSSDLFTTVQATLNTWCDIRYLRDKVKLKIHTLCMLKTDC